jgi:hypothetical protein
MKIHHYAFIAFFAASLVAVANHPQAGDRYCGNWMTPPTAEGAPAQRCFKLDTEMSIMTDNAQCFYLPQALASVYKYEIKNKLFIIHRTVSDELYDISEDGQTLTHRNAPSHILRLCPPRQ